MLGKRHPFTSYPAAKHPKHSKSAITDMQEKPADFFFLYDMGVEYSSYSNLGSFAKVSILVESNSLNKVHTKLELRSPMIVEL